jgi:hypothetical protein
VLEFCVGRDSSVGKKVGLHSCSKYSRLRKFHSPLLLSSFSLLSIRWSTMLNIWSLHCNVLILRVHHSALASLQRAESISQGFNLSQNYKSLIFDMREGYWPLSVLEWNTSSGKPKNSIDIVTLKLFIIEHIAKCLTKTVIELGMLVQLEKHLPRIHKALSFIPSTQESKQQQRK